MRAQLLARWKYETARRATFSNWRRHDLPISTNEFAKAGFIYFNDADRVQCVFCLGIVEGWVNGDDPMTKHRLCYPQCPFVSGLPVGNMPILPPGFDFQGLISPPRLQLPLYRARSLERLPSKGLFLHIFFLLQKRNLSNSNYRLSKLATSRRIHGQ
jgi:hypothetical protein